MVCGMARRTTWVAIGFAWGATAIAQPVPAPPEAEVILPADIKPADFVYVAATSQDRIGRIMAPVFVNGVVFALASGEARAAGQRAGNAVLYAIDAATGKELWNSGTTITSPVHNVGPAVDDGQVLVVTSDGTLYTFGFVVER